MNATEELIKEIKRVFNVEFSNKEVYLTKLRGASGFKDYFVVTPNGQFKANYPQPGWNEKQYAESICRMVLSHRFTRHPSTAERDAFVYITHYSEWMTREGDDRHGVLKFIPRVSGPEYPHMHEILVMKTRNSNGEWNHTSKMNSYFRAILGIEEPKLSKDSPIEWEEHDDNKVRIDQDDNVVYIPSDIFNSGYAESTRRSIYDPVSGILEVIRLEGYKRTSYYEKSQLYRAKSGKIMRKILSKTPPEWLCQLARFGSSFQSPYLMQEGIDFLDHFEKSRCLYNGLNVYVTGNATKFIRVPGGWITLTPQVLETFDIPEDTRAEIQICEQLL